MHSGSEWIFVKLWLLHRNRYKIKNKLKYNIYLVKPEASINCFRLFREKMQNLGFRCQSRTLSSWNTSLPCFIMSAWR